MVKEKIEYVQIGISLGKFDAYVCPACGEKLFEGHVSEQIEKRAKELGVWGLARKTSIGTSGSSLDVKLPKSIAEFLQLKKGQEVVVEPRNKRKIEITLI